MVKRQQVWIDQHVQGVLVGRVLLYWSGILIYFALSTVCFHWWQNPEWTLSEHVWAFLDQIWLCLPTLVLLLPLVIFDIVRLSNRFAGPVYRLRKHLTDLSQNSQTAPLNFRDDDYWQQLAEPINLLQQKMLVLEQQVQTLSFVHQSLSEGDLPNQVPAHETDAHPADSGKFVSLDSDEEALPPIPPMPIEPNDSFVTQAAH